MCLDEIKHILIINCLINFYNCLSKLLKTTDKKVDNQKKAINLQMAGHVSLNHG